MSEVARLVAVVLVLGVLEVAWALYCSETGANIFLFYGVLIAASAVFWIPGIATKRPGPT